MDKTFRPPGNKKTKEPVKIKLGYRSISIFNLQDQKKHPIGSMLYGDFMETVFSDIMKDHYGGKHFGEVFKVNFIGGFPIIPKYYPNSVGAKKGNLSLLYEGGVVTVIFKSESNEDEWAYLIDYTLQDFLSLFGLGGFVVNELHITHCVTVTDFDIEQTGKEG